MLKVATRNYHDFFVCLRSALPIKCKKTLLSKTILDLGLLTFDNIFTFTAVVTTSIKHLRHKKS